MKVVLVHGTFDLLHLGHVRLFRAASEIGRVVVSITADQHVTKRKVVFTQDERAEMIKAIRYVSEVRVIDGPTGIPAIQSVRPNVYVKGGDYSAKMTDALKEEKAMVEQLGGVLRIINTGNKWHSSDLLSGKALRDAHAK